MRVRRAGYYVLLVVCSVVLLGGCTPTGPAWVDEGAEYTLEEARALLDRIEIDEVAQVSTADANDVRQEALAGLRNQGDAASDAATLITSVFPTDVRSVPVYVERATVDGTDSLIVIEAWGPADGTLSLERSWVIDAETGAILDTAAAR